MWKEFAAVWIASRSHSQWEIQKFEPERKFAFVNVSSIASDDSCVWSSHTVIVWVSNVQHEMRNEIYTFRSLILPFFSPCEAFYRDIITIHTHTQNTFYALKYLFYCVCIGLYRTVQASYRFTSCRL